MTASSPASPDRALPHVPRTVVERLAAGAHLMPALVPILDEAGWLRERDALVRRGALHEVEARLADTLPMARRGTFVSGRIALRAAIAALQGQPVVDVAPIGRDARGAPVLADGMTGSITHKRDVALAVAAPRSPVLHTAGIDLERRPEPRDLERRSIASRILTPREQVALAAFTHDELARRERTVLLFSLKEAVYKAIDPFVGRYVRFTEVELDVASDGGAEVTLLLPEFAQAPVRVEARWYVDGPWIVTMATGRRG